MSIRRSIGRRAAALAAVLGLMAAMTGLGVGPASAHSAGQAVVLVRGLTLAPAGDAWQATVTIADFDSGAPIQQSSVILLTPNPAAQAVVAPAAANAQQQEAAPAAKPKAAGNPKKKAAATIAAAKPEPILRTPLVPSTVIGQYQGTLPDAKPGPLQLELQVRTQPGSAAVQPYDKTWNVNLVAGQPTEIVKSDNGGGGSSLPLIIGVAAVVLVGAMLYGLFSVRRRTAVPARAS
jgi:hypothetical protein